MTLFLTCNQVIRFPEKKVERFGGSAGVADEGLLKSALAMPEMTCGNQLLYQSSFDKAAAYLFHLVQNQRFIDGNKRIDGISAFVFLRVNDYDLTASSEDFERLVMRVANSELEKFQIAAFLETHSRRRT